MHSDYNDVISLISQRADAILSPRLGSSLLAAGLQLCWHSDMAKSDLCPDRVHSRREGLHYVISLSTRTPQLEVAGLLITLSDSLTL